MYYNNQRGSGRGYRGGNGGYSQRGRSFGGGRGGRRMRFFDPTSVIEKQAELETNITPQEKIAYVPVNSFGDFITRIKFGYLIITLFVVVEIFSVTTARGDYGLKVKRGLVNDVMGVVDGKPFDLSEDGGCHKYEAWRYLFSVYGRIPERSDEDQVYGWLYPNELSNKQSLPLRGRKTDFSVVISETRAQTPQSGYKYSFTEGGFTAYIYEK